MLITTLLDGKSVNQKTAKDWQDVKAAVDASPSKAKIEFNFAGKVKRYDASSLKRDERLQRARMKLERFTVKNGS